MEGEPEGGMGLRQVDRGVDEAANGLYEESESVAVGRRLSEALIEWGSIRCTWNRNRKTLDCLKASARGGLC